MLPDNIIPVQAFPVNDTTGDMRLLSFRYEDENHAIRKISDITTLSTQECNYVGMRCIRCICKAVDEEQEVLFEMRFLIDSHKWVFYQKLY